MLWGRMSSAAALAAVLSCAWPDVSFAEGGAAACKLIRNVAQLQAIQNDLDGSYCLAKDIDASSDPDFEPISAFTGDFFGNDHVIRNLTINSSEPNVGLFGTTDGALIQDVGLVNAKVTGSAQNGDIGGLVGQVGANGTTMSRVHVTGQVQCTALGCRVGGIVGHLDFTSTLAESWSSAKVIGNTSYTGGAVSWVGAWSTMSRTYATGPVTCADGCYAGGLVGVMFGAVNLSYATGPVTAGEVSRVGGLIGQLFGGSTRQSYAAGAVTGGDGSYGVGGLIGSLAVDGTTVTQTYAVGPVAAGPSSNIGGLIGEVVNTPTVTSSYWDIPTTGQTTSTGGYGTGQTTTGLRAALPAGFDSRWAITKTKSYPFLNDFDFDLASPLATLVRENRVFVFLPIGQLDTSQYAEPPLHADAASQAALYTIIARAIGTAKKIARLRNAKISRYWNDVTETAHWDGAVTTHATLGALVPIAAGARLDSTNVIGELRKQRLVILRGVYTTSSGASATHWMLGTLFTRDGSDKLAAVVAHDPWTGRQVMIDPATKKVFSPASFPLARFRVNGYRQVTLN